MLIRQKLLIATATLTLLGTVAITPAQAFTLSFQSTDGKVTGNIISPDSGISMSTIGISMSTMSILGQGWSSFGGFYSFPKVQVGNQWLFKSLDGGGWGNVKLLTTNFPDLSLPSVEPVNNMPSDLPRISPILERSNTNPIVSFLCHSDSNCLGDFGSITLNMSFFDSGRQRLYSWVGYSGEIQVTAWNPTGTSIPIAPTLPTNSVPEPSSALTMLLLGCGWLLRQKLAVD
ncbi:hypothetical protein ACE1B6_05750 [Aerosakkonemataceae cyanobacterium BLCC-F154]|uniref:PEP-CTERM protein-sorting domain-containing protein n=1 Tax=Floridaenema fluviatile BLCC-F154 TaxID=3153640 RepID=A0ABV4Y7J0_9CYAN